MKALLRSVFVLFLLSDGITVYSTHLAGSHMTYRSLGGNVIEITLKVYRDCYNGIPGFDQPAYISIFDEDSVRIKDLAVNVSQIDTMQFFPADTCVDTSLFSQTSFCIEIGTYVVVDTIPNLGKGIFIAYDRCCLPGITVNIYDALQIGTSVLLFIADSTALNNNSSPLIDPSKGDLACTWIYNSIRKTATDADGDSIHYSFVAPLNSTRPIMSELPPLHVPYERMIFSTGYSASQPFGGFPTTLDSDSGILEVGPVISAGFMYGLRLDEYRNGKFIGYSEYTGFLFSVPYGQDTTDTTNPPWLGLKPLVSTAEPNLFPNPVSDEFMLSFDSVDSYWVSLYNAQAELILFEKFTGDRKHINTSSLSPGVYVVRISSAEMNWSKKLVKLE